MAAGPSVKEGVAWQERAFVTISEKGASSDIDFHGFMSEMSWSGGSKGVEGQPMMNGGRLTQYESQEDFEFSATLYITGVSPDEASGISAFFHGSDDQLDGETGQYEYEATLSRSDFRIAVLFTDDSNVTSAVDEVAAGQSAYRWICTGAKLTDYEPSFDDQTLTVEVTFTIPPFDTGGAAQVREQELTSSATNPLAELSSY